MRPARLADAHWLAIELLRKKCPVSRPVEIRVVRRIRVVSGDPVGATLYNPKRRAFIVYIKAGEPFRETQDTIGHEWAHVLAYPSIAHGPKFGIQYARCYRALTGAA